MVKRFALLIAIMSFVYMLFSCSEHKSQRSDGYAESKSVKLINPGVGQCSGEQVQAPSGDSYILTAAHCRGIGGPSGIFTVVTEEGYTLQRNLIAEDSKSDLLLIQGLPNVEGLKIADTITVKQHVKTFTHGHGMNTYKTEGHLVQVKEIKVPTGMIDAEHPCTDSKYTQADSENPFMPGKICLLTVEETVSTARVIPGSSGGMALNDNNELIGVVSAGDDFFGCFVTLKDIKLFLMGY